MKKLFRNIAANEAAVATNEILVIGAANIRAFTGDEWEQVTPWGDFPNEKGLQRLNKRTGQAMVDAFNSTMAKIKHTVSPVAVYAGHPDVDPERWPDDRRRGKIVALEARDDGLYCKPAYNNLGEENKKEGYWVYPSGVWKFKRLPGGVIEPYELVSVGLTNSPNIKDVKPWTANAKAANAGTSQGALKGWETRRRNGTVGAKNPRAVRALATMTAKKAGRKATKEDKAAAAEKLKASMRKEGLRKMREHSKTANEHLKKGDIKSAEREESKMFDVARKHGLKLEDHYHITRPLSDKIVSAESKAEREAARPAPKPTPPPLPKTASSSSSAGPGTHIHIHAGGGSDAPAPAKTRGLIASILDAFARPHVHDGGAVNSTLEDFYGPRRRVAVNARRETAEA